MAYYPNNGKKRTYNKKSNGKRNVIKGLAGEKPSNVEKYVNKKGAIGAIASAVAGLTKMGSPEKKNRDAYSGFPGTCSPLSNGGLLLSGILQGATSVTRIGDKVKGDNLFIRSLWQMGASNTTQSNIRYWVILDKEFNGQVSLPAAPAYGEIFQNGSALTTFMNLDYSKRFVVLKTRSFQLDRNGKSSIQFMDKIPVNFTLNYRGQLGTVAECKENQIFMYWISDDGTSAGQPTEVVLSTRLTFYDE